MEKPKKSTWQTGWWVGIVALFLFSASFGADKPIYAVGTVFDEESGEPIGFVNVYTRSEKKLGTSNSKGRFEVEVGSEKAILVFKRFGFDDVELDLSEFSDLIDLEVGMSSSVKELQELKVTKVSSGQRAEFKNQSVEELEQFQGMRIDLNDHLRQLEGVSGMTEYSSDISVYGSRTEDVTHYLGLNPIANMRHLDFGLPGNQSVINPRLLRSVSLEDNLSKGPVGQGNASALQYELKEGDPESITGDIVIGTINQEVNASFYWDSLTVMFSYRFLFSPFLANMGKQFFLLPKESRLGSCPENQECKRLEDPIDINSEDGLLSIYRRKAGGGHWRLFTLVASDDFTILQDVDDFSDTEAREIQDGLQRNGIVAYETLTPLESGDLSYSLSTQAHNTESIQKDTSLELQGGTNDFFFYESDYREKLMGNSHRSDLTVASVVNWDPSARLLWGGKTSFGLNLKYINASGAYMGRSNNLEDLDGLSYVLSDGMVRSSWILTKKSGLESSLGWHSVDVARAYPLASVRYLYKLLGINTYGDVSLRQNTLTQPVGYNNIDAVTTSSAEGRIGAQGKLGESFNYSGSVYSRYYLEPTLPVPEVYWNYIEEEKAEYAAVFGGNLNVRWEPSHHFGANLNGSIVQGDYYLEGDGALPWEANRSLDLVSNMRVVPRNDSLLSFILTYTVNNDVPLYEYEIARNSLNGDENPGRRTIRQSRETPQVSRQRTDMRINLDLKSTWKPIETVRFFFQGNNLFADLDVKGLEWLGGQNEKQRGWTRIADWQNKNTSDIGDLTPVVIRGLGFFWMFGFEIFFSI